MGCGDEIMALGRAEVVYQTLGHPVAICGVSGNPRKHELWEGTPAVDFDSPLKILDGPSARPYILRWVRNPGLTSVFNPKYKARAGKVYLTQEEQKRALELTPEKPFALVEPIIRGRSSINKDWGFSKWAEVVKDFPISVYQFKVDGEGTKLLPGVKGIDVETFRISMGVAQYSSLIMTNDGGMHHMAASLGVPAVVIFGGFADPKITGYPFQRNFYVDSPESPCGRYTKCEHCKAAMEFIKPSTVRKAALEILERQGVI